jgi:hypothetical protein
MLSAPRALVAATSQGLWKEAVVAITRVAGVVVIDASELSGSIEWELRTLAKDFSGKSVVLVHESARVPAWLSDAGMRTIPFGSIGDLTEVFADAVRQGREKDTPR